MSTKGAGTAPKFRLGTVVGTPGAIASIPRTEVLIALMRHWEGDWGDLGDGDRAANDAALRDGGRLFSAYRSASGTRFWIITEWDRSVTTVLLPDEY